MKNVTFDYDSRRWSPTYGFNNSHHPFVQREDNSVTLMSGPQRGDPRTWYNAGLEARWSESAPDMFLLPRHARKCSDDRKPIPAAWLNQGGQTALIIDREQGVVMGYNRNRVIYKNEAKANTNEEPRDFNPQEKVPDNADYCYAYWPKAGVLPIAMGDITLSMPGDRRIRRDFAQREKEVKATVGAALALKGGSWWYSSTPFTVDLDRMEHWTTSQFVAEVMKDSAVAQNVSKNGFFWPRKKEKRVYLYLA